MSDALTDMLMTKLLGRMRTAEVPMYIAQALRDLAQRGADFGGHESCLFVNAHCLLEHDFKSPMELMAHMAQVHGSQSCADALITMTKCLVAAYDHIDLTCKKYNVENPYEKIGPEAEGYIDPVNLRENVNVALRIAEKLHEGVHT